MLPTLVRKIISKNVLGAAPEVPDKAKALYTVYGVVNSVKPDKTQYGMFFRLIGSFEAVNLATGEVFRSGQCILPEPIGNMMGTDLLSLQRSNVKKVERTDEKGQKITVDEEQPLDARFGFEIGIKPNKTPMRFEWTARPIVEVQGNDPLEALRQEVKKALPAPVKK